MCIIFIFLLMGVIFNIAVFYCKTPVYMNKALIKWTYDDINKWIIYIGNNSNENKQSFNEYGKYFQDNHIDGKYLSSLTQDDLRRMGILSIGHQKYIISKIKSLIKEKEHELYKIEFNLPSPDQMLSSLLMKNIVTFTYLIFSAFITAFVMVMVQYRVPEQQTYPPLPDIVLDSIPLIPWAFKIAEYILATLGCIAFIIIIFHKHRLILLRRISCIMATTYLMRSVTMYVTSLSVPGTHLDCPVLDIDTPIEEKLQRAFEIASGLGLSINGVQTCGDYMFSGHTVALTLLNYFILQYSPISFTGLHIFSSILNAFGMFFILAAHEHYTLDVIVAFYVASRLFLYYHEAADSKRGALQTTLFPLFYYLEEDRKKPLKNQYEWPWMILIRVYKTVKVLTKPKQK